jgi:hypothetical protein
MWKSPSLLAIAVTFSTLSIATVAQAQFRGWGSEGTIIGRVFVDSNGDGEKQAGELGIANAVIFTDDGLRVTTDEYGRFTIPSAYPGYRSAALDLSSIPGYQVAPNPHRIDRNVPSHFVRIAPGSLARMNFAVAPTPEKSEPRVRVAKTRQPQAKPQLQQTSRLQK